MIIQGMVGGEGAAREMISAWVGVGGGGCRGMTVLRGMI